MTSQEQRSTCCVPQGRSPVSSWRREPRQDLTSADVVDTLIDDRRMVEVRIAGQAMLAVAEDMPRLRDGLGIPVPPGVAASFTELATHPIDDLVVRWARTHGPFVVSVDRRTLRTRAGNRRVGVRRLDRLRQRRRRVVCRPTRRGSQRTASVLPQSGARADQATHVGNAAQKVEPVEQVAYARFLAEWQGVGSDSRGVDAVLGGARAALRVPIPASAVESMILPARVEDYTLVDAGRADHHR